nr:cobalamin biosynthesis protein [uncultured Actinoplanes sp.]
MIVVGVGARGAATTEELRAAVDTVLEQAGIAGTDVAILATVARRAADHAVREMAREKGWRLSGWPAEELARQRVPNPSVTVAGRAGTPSVAEAAALCAAGPRGRLIVTKRILRNVTVAVAVAA